MGMKLTFISNLIRFDKQWNEARFALSCRRTDAVKCSICERPVNYDGTIACEHKAEVRRDYSNRSIPHFVAKIVEG